MFPSQRDAGRAVYHGVMANALYAYDWEEAKGGYMKYAGDWHRKTARDAAADGDDGVAKVVNRRR